MWTQRASFAEFRGEDCQTPVVLKVPAILTPFLRWQTRVLLKKVRRPEGWTFVLLSPSGSIPDIRGSDGESLT